MYYEVHHLRSAIVNPDNHILCLVTNVHTRGDRFLVDVGMGYPSFEPIPLDFERESRIYRQSFLEYKFVWEDGQCARYHRQGETRPIMPGEVSTDGWRRVCVIDPSPKDLSFFTESMHKVYSQPDLMYSPFHHSLRLVSFQHTRAVCVRDKCLLTENDAHTMEERILTTREDMVEKISELFPVLHDATEAAVANLKLYD